MYFKDYMKVLQDIVNYKATYLLHFISFNNIFSANKTWNELIKVYRETEITC